ncbi:MAG: LuxR family transcriptional regulator [Chromatiaceae bacterium]|nr:MAG: LuxR family transcriptional regulator [Chromatiaceae bacterium]
MQQLAQLGLPPQVAVPLLLRALHVLVDTRWNSLFWCDRYGQITNLYAESPAAMALAPRYFQQFYNQRELEVFIGWPAVCRQVRRATRAEALLRVPRRTLVRHPLYRELLRHLQVQRALYLVVREGERPLGILALHRARGDPPFAADELRRVDRLAGVFRRALSAVGPSAALRWLDPGAEGEGLILADADGTIHWLSANARRMLAMASCERLCPGMRCLQHLAQLSPPLRRLARAVADRGNDRADAAAPSWWHDNAWGRFRFHAQALDANGGSWSPLVGISVRHQRPLQVGLMRQIEQLQLPPRQAQVCLLMACGQSYGGIAQRLGLAESTVISHARAIYRDVDAHNRGELIGRLLAL